MIICLLSSFLSMCVCVYIDDIILGRGNISDILFVFVP